MTNHGVAYLTTDRFQPDLISVVKVAELQYGQVELFWRAYYDHRHEADVQDELADIMMHIMDIFGMVMHEFHAKRVNYHVLPLAIVLIHRRPELEGLQEKIEAAFGRLELLLG